MTNGIAATAIVLTAVCSTFAQGFEDYDYTTTTTTSSSSSEDKFTLFFDVGAGFSIGGIQKGTSTIIETTAGPTTVTAEVDDEFLNAGRGLKLDIGAMYRIMPSVDVLAAFAVSFGIPRVEVVNETTDRITNTRQVWTRTYHIAQLGPKVVVAPRFKVFDLLDIYIGAGLGLYFTPYSLEIQYDDASGAVFSQEVEFDTKPTVPFIGMAGIEYPIARRLVLAFDLSYEAMNVTVKEQRVVTSSFNQPWPEQTQRFEDDVEDRPAQPRVPASNFTLRLGVRVPIL
jgi:hypothetical protein